jgi:4a-hydroxytetrahydrobiopterin dehydratase
MSDLATRTCQPISGAPLSADQQAALLAQVPGWKVVDGALQRCFEMREMPELRDYGRLLAFANAVAWIAMQQDHHPDLQLSWGRCVVRWSTHSVGGLSINDFICAARVDALHA